MRKKEQMLYDSIFMLLLVTLRTKMYPFSSVRTHTQTLPSATIHSQTEVIVPNLLNCLLSKNNFIFDINVSYQIHQKQIMIQ